MADDHQQREQQPEGQQQPKEEPHGARRDQHYREAAERWQAEAQRQAVIIERYQRAEVEALASGLAAPADLWSGGVKLADLLDEEHMVDAEKVQAAVKGVLEAHPHWAWKAPALPGNGGQEEKPVPREPQWSDVLRPR